MHEIFALNRRINALRKFAGESNSELAARLGYSESTIRDWERGNTTPGVMVLCDIADHFEVSMDYLMSGEFIPGKNDGMVPEAQTLGERLKGLRAITGLQHKEIAELVGIKSCTLCGYERDEEIPRRNNLLRLADVLDVSLDYLILGKTGGGKNDGAVKVAGKEKKHD